MANIKELVNKNREQLVKETARRGIFGVYDTKELIARIVEHDAYYTGRQDEKNKREDRHVRSNEHLQKQAQSDAKPPRTMYKFQSDNEEYYVKITKEQDNFLDWLINKDVIDPNVWCIGDVKDIQIDEP